MGRRRPWRALAFRPDATAPNGRKRELVGRTSACTREGLEAWVSRQQRAGNVVDVLEVAPLPLGELVRADGQPC